MLRFDKKSLGQSLNRLPNEYRTAFAAACAQRLLPRYTAFYARPSHKDQEPVAEGFLNLLWRDLSERRLDGEEIGAMIKRLDATLPDEETAWAANEPYCADAGAAVIYALETQLTGQVKFAVLPAQRIYNALDNFVINNKFPNNFRMSALEEETVLTCPLIQRELARQQADLKMLNSAYEGAYDKATVLFDLRKRAEEESEKVFLL